MSWVMAMTKEQHTAIVVCAHADIGTATAAVLVHQ